MQPITLIVLYIWFYVFLKLSMIAIDYICIPRHQYLKCGIKKIMTLFEPVPKFQLHNDVLTNLLLNFSMFQFLSTFEIILKFGHIHADDMLKFSCKSGTSNMLP